MSREHKGWSNYAKWYVHHWSQTTPHKQIFPIAVAAKNLSIEQSSGLAREETIDWVATALYSHSYASNPFKSLIVAGIGSLDYWQGLVNWEELANHWVAEAIEWKAKHGKFPRIAPAEEDG